VFICEGGLQPIKVQCCAQSLVPGTVREAAGGIKPGVSGANPGERFNPRIVSPRSGGWPWTARTHWAWWEWKILHLPQARNSRRTVHIHEKFMRSNLRIRAWMIG